MNLYNLNNVTKLLFYLQVNFNQDLCFEIFGGDWEHYYAKWLCFENIIIFIDRLDDIQRGKIYNWMLNNQIYLE